MVETVCIIQPGDIFSPFLEVNNGKNNSSSDPVHFLTVGERGIVRIWSCEGYDWSPKTWGLHSFLFSIFYISTNLLVILFCNSAICIYEQPLSSGESDSRRGLLSAVFLPSDLGLLCATADQEFLFYCPTKSTQGTFQLNLYKRFVGYNEEILDMRFLGDDEQYLAVATNLEQVCYYFRFNSNWLW